MFKMRVVADDLANIGDGPGARRGRGRALVRGEIEDVLDEIKRARDAARRDEALQLDRLAALLAVARAADFSYEAIAAASGVSRPTLNRLREPERLGTADAELAVLLVLALEGGQDAEQIETKAVAWHLDAEWPVAPVLKNLEGPGLVARSIAEQDGELRTFWRLTAQGEQSLIERLRRSGIGDEFRWCVYFSIEEAAGRALLVAGEKLLGAHQVVLIAPGTAANEQFELGFIVRAASRPEATARGRELFAGLCRDAGVEPADAILAVLALEPRPFPA